MEKRSLALQSVSEAIHLDSEGFHQAAFVKYLQSLQTLSLYLNDLYTTFGFDKMLEKKKEVKQVLSALKESSDRVTSILDIDGKQSIDSTSLKICRGSSVNPKTENQKKKIIHLKFPAFEKVQNDNVILFRTYQLRIERALDKYTKTNLRLELQRRVAENLELAKAKYALAVKEHQKESLAIMEQTMKKLFVNGKSLNAKELEKKELYTRVLHYSSNETWPCSLECSSPNFPAFKVVQNVFQRTVYCREHPLHQWLLKVQTKLKQDIDILSNQYSECGHYLPYHDLHVESTKLVGLLIASDQTSLHLSLNNEAISIPLDKFSYLQKDLEPVSEEIYNTIENALQVFYLTYKALLPEDSESICYKLVETYFLQPLWPNLVILFRLINLPNEYKVLGAMLENKASLPTAFGFHLNNEIKLTDMYQDIITKLRNLPYLSSLTEKLENLVQVSQKLCEGDHLKSVNTGKRLIGADDFIPLLCYVIVQTGTYRLVSECYALEQLFDQKYLFGEEGYALSSFLTALKYLEMKS